LGGVIPLGGVLCEVIFLGGVFLGGVFLGGVFLGGVFLGGVFFTTLLSVFLVVYVRGFVEKNLGNGILSGFFEENLLMFTSGGPFFIYGKKLFLW